MDIYKEKLPDGWSFGLKPSRLEGAITDAGIRLPVSLHQRHKVWNANTSILSANFYTSGSYLGKEDGAFSVTSCAVPASQREVMQDLAEKVFLPALIAWIESIEALPQNSTIRREEQEFACDGAPPALNKRPVALIPKRQRRRKRA